MIDGLPVVAAAASNDAAIIPNLEGISSVQVLTNAYSAEYGRGAGQFSITSKSGTNKYHGVADYEHPERGPDGQFRLQQGTDLRGAGKSDLPARKMRFACHSPPSLQSE